MVNITKKICSNWGERNGYKPEIIVIHISTGSLASMTSWFQNPASQVSAHYGVGKDGTVLQYVEESKASWANGRVLNPTFKLLKPNVNPNQYTISIENEGDNLLYAPEKQLDTLAALIKEIATRYNIPIDRDHIIGHYQVDGVNKPYCPSSTHSVVDKIVDRAYNINSTNEIINVPTNDMTIKTTAEVMSKILTSNRFKSFYWRTGMMVLALVIQQLTVFSTGLDLSPSVTVVLGLILGEISKSINTALQQTPAI